MTQFVAAFNDIVISRYNKSREVVDKIKPRFVYAPKERVLHDLVNKGQHLTLPVVAVTVGSVARDESRVFNKIFGSIENTTTGTHSTHLPSPVPVNIEVNMSIMTRFQTDMDQIVSNFVPYSNPYVIISWPVPTGLLGSLQEIRSAVSYTHLTLPTKA